MTEVIKIRTNLFIILHHGRPSAPEARRYEGSGVHTYESLVSLGFHDIEVDHVFRDLRLIERETGHDHGYPRVVLEDVLEDLAA